MAKLNPRCDAFFQYPRKNSKWKYADEVWFDARPIGANKLDGMMKNISEEAKLSKMYTNHSVRATAITLWSNAGVQNRHIMASLVTAANRVLYTTTRSPQHHSSAPAVKSFREA